MSNNILVVGSGAREHAIIKALKKSSNPLQIYCLATNQNPGIISHCKKTLTVNINDPDVVLKYALQNNISLAIIGPENPLAKGVSDILWNNKIKVIGPKKNHAQIESSKSFTRNLLKKYKIPGGPIFKTFLNMDNAKKFIKKLNENYVIKYDGLAGGKGVKVFGDHIENDDQALLYCKEIINRGGKFLIEEKFIGEEFSLMSFCDGSTLKHMPAIQDHKRAFDDDKGPNTGGMGAYSDANHSLPFLSNKDIEDAKNINCQTAYALKEEFGEGYKGILYGGFMAVKDGVKLIEYNARFGDPEAMNALSILESDFFNICNSLANGELNKINIKFNNMATVSKYAVPRGYPNNPVKGKRINVSNITNNDLLYYAAVEQGKKSLIQTGSRAIAIVAKGNTISSAEKIAEKEISTIGGPLFYRKDIGTDTLIKKRIKHMHTIR